MNNQVIDQIHSEDSPKVSASPREIQRLIEKRAFDDWYATQYEKSRVTNKNESCDRFLPIEKKKVRKLIRKLSDREQVIVYLRYWENLMAYQIASLVGLSEDAVLQILSTSITRLRTLYGSVIDNAQKFPNVFQERWSSL